MNKQHTPGPWRIENDTICSTDGDIAKMHFQSCRGRNTEKANARLIAAAPDLLRACSQLIEIVDQYHADLDYAIAHGMEENEDDRLKTIGDMLGDAQAAIQKARGE